MKELENGQILIERESGVWTHFDMKFHTELSFDGGIVTAQYFDYENNSVNYNGDVTFECEGQSFTTQAINGTATMTLDIAIGETVTVRTINEGIRNGEVVLSG